MATIYKRYTRFGDVRYYGSITLHGKRIRKMLGYTRKGAELCLKKLEYDTIFQSAKGKVEKAAPPIPSAILSFLRSMERSGVGLRQMETVCTRLKCFDCFCMGQDIKYLQDVKPIHASSFLDARRSYKSPTLQKPLSTSTLNKELQSLRRLFVYAGSMEWTDSNPFLCIRPLKQKPQSERYYFKANDLKYIFKCYTIYSDIYKVMLYTGLRPTDAYRLCPDHIKGRYLVLRMRKTSTWLNIPISDKILEILKPRMEGEFIFPEALDDRGRSGALKRVQECFTREFVRENNINLHTFRHTYAHNMLNRGVPKEVLQTLLGHLSIKTTEVYANWVCKGELEKWV